MQLVAAAVLALVRFGFWQAQNAIPVHNKIANVNNFFIKVPLFI